jgi:hypothetical protein
MQVLFSENHRYAIRSISDLERTHSISCLLSSAFKYRKAFLTSFLNNFLSNVIFDKINFEYSSILHLNFIPRIMIDLTIDWAWLQGHLHHPINDSDLQPLADK